MTEVKNESMFLPIPVPSPTKMNIAVTWLLFDAVCASENNAALYLYFRTILIIMQSKWNINVWFPSCCCIYLMRLTELLLTFKILCWVILLTFWSFPLSHLKTSMRDFVSSQTQWQKGVFLDKSSIRWVDSHLAILTAFCGKIAMCPLLDSIVPGSSCTHSLREHGWENLTRSKTMDAVCSGSDVWEAVHLLTAAFSHSLRSQARVEIKVEAWVTLGGLGFENWLPSFSRWQTREKAFWRAYYFCN